MILFTSWCKKVKVCANILQTFWVYIFRFTENPSAWAGETSEQTQSDPQRFCVGQKFLHSVRNRQRSNQQENNWVRRIFYHLWWAKQLWIGQIHPSLLTNCRLHLLLLISAIQQPAASILDPFPFHPLKLSLFLVRGHFIAFLITLIFC